MKKQSRYSPGPVCSKEILLRIIYSPAHIDDAGQLKPEAIPSQDLKERGFSVFRKLYSSRKKLSAVIENYVSKKPQRSCKGVSSIECRKVRSISDYNNKQAFNVFDDAQTEEDKAHAKIIYSKKYNKAEHKSLRKKLLDELSVILEVEKIYRDLGDTKAHNKN